MKEQQQRNRRTILIVFAMSIIPFCIAWYLSVNAEWMGAGTNKGKLIIPPLTTERSEFQGYDQFSKDNIGELTGHWVLVNVVPGSECNEVCLNAIHKTRQLRLMMNKDLTRIRRVAVLLSKPAVSEQGVTTWWKDDLRLLRVIPKQSLAGKIKQISKGQPIDGMLILMDPLGNLMMQYKSGFDPYDVKKDLSKLLRISQIG